MVKDCARRFNVAKEELTVLLVSGILLLCSCGVM